ncbi:alpha/beta hydrolase [Actinoplanes sp. ATCC 53533]|uniref:alpha/beta fold hydrolase n=1 Tax=Actinoplanes sp. ATCC 53533 TaxID=1288362 RepID=UPI000F7AF37A|nr:alpha/beta fold hydrolase [Actinoplanes sp. ATCC 53533]RSM48075.1 alpha/beta hydrolase [Actinoplanes sp. ATCC 53533]
MITELTVRGARIRVRRSGDPAHPPVLLLHGIGRSLEDWDPQHDRLSADHRVISVDLPGFGLSEPMPGRVTLAALAEGVAATVAALGEERPVHVMGNSLGGAVAMRMLAAAPARIATLTLVNSAGFGKEVTPALRILAVPGLGKQLLRRIDARSAYRIERSLFHDRAHVTEERVAFALRVAARPDNARVFLETARELGTLLGVRAAWRQRLLSQVAAHPRPSLIVWGDRDLILPAAHLAAARAAFPHAKTHLFADTGHLPQIERADDFADLARLFLTAHSSAV